MERGRGRKVQLNKVRGGGASGGGINGTAPMRLSKVHQHQYQQSNIHTIYGSDRRRPRGLRLFTRLMAFKRNWVMLGICFLLVLYCTGHLSTVMEMEMEMDIDMEEQNTIIIDEGDKSKSLVSAETERETETETSKMKIDLLLENFNNDDECFRPRSKPILGTSSTQPQKNISSRIINVGFPKVGSASISKLFQLSGFSNSHYICQSSNLDQEGQADDNDIESKFCGPCFEKNLHEEQQKQQRRRQEEDQTYSNTARTSSTSTRAISSILSNCGNYTVYTELNYLEDGRCIFPQVQYLNELYRDASDATWILPFRNVTAWVKSVTGWRNMKLRLLHNCTFPDLGFPSSRSRSRTVSIPALTDFEGDLDLINLYCNHVKQIRQFVDEHPTLSLVEFSIEDPYVGTYLANIFPGVNATGWGQTNTMEDWNEKFDKKKMMKEETSNSNN